ncbi:GlxA family transcriptional regulator [Ottowia sp.]|uniref:GlxA family transcriptional regulator n=1 Tax=Ottowia sp. TaxID=1898956 RepID=UPI0039E5C71F
MQAQFVIAVLDGALASSVGATLDVLGMAGRGAAALGLPAPAWRVVGAREQVQLSGGMALAARPLEGARLPAGAVLVFPGLGLEHADLGAGGDIHSRYDERQLLRRMAMPDAQAFARLAQRHRARGGRVAASCSGVLLPAMAGLLDGREATTHWRLGSFFHRHFPQIRLDTRRMVVDAEGVVSAGAAMAQMDLMLYLLRRLCGRALAELVTSYLLIDARPTQARYQVWAHVAEPGDETARRFEALIEASLPAIPTVSEAARQMHLTEKTLSRRLRKSTGATPMALIHGVRMRHARRLLELGELTLEEVAQRVGYANATSLRKLTLRMARVAPGTLRPAHAPDS